MQQGFQFILDHYLEAGKKVSVEDPSHKVLCVSLKRELANRFPINDWIIKGSTGQGYRTDYPWLAILNRKITASTMHGLYMVYLFRSDMRGFYLSLNQGITHFAEKYKNRRYDFAEKVADYFRKELPSSYFSRGEIDLNSRVKDLGYGYEKTNIISKYYPSHGFTENELITDLTAMREIYDFLYKHFPPSSNYDDIVEHVIDFVSSNNEDDRRKRFLVDADKAELSIREALGKDDSAFDDVDVSLEEVEPKSQISKALEALDDDISAKTKIDFLKKAETNAKVGLHGEQLAIEYERKRLASIGLTEYVDKIKWMSIETDSAGYDIESFDLINGKVKPIKIEVKSTMSKVDREFFVSIGEVMASNKYKDSYFVYRIYHIRSIHPKIYRVSGPIEENFAIDPVTFLARYRGQTTF